MKRVSSDRAREAMRRDAQVGEQGPVLKILLTVSDKNAQDLLWVYADRRQAPGPDRDIELGATIKQALMAQGYPPPSVVVYQYSPERVDAAERKLRTATSLARDPRAPRERIEGDDIRAVLYELTRLRGMVRV